MGKENDLTPDWQKEQAVEYRLCWIEDDIKDYIDGIPSNTEVAIDTETTGLDTEVANIVGISICPRPKEAIYIPIAHVTGGEGYNVPVSVVGKYIKRLCENNTILFYNADFDGEVLYKAFGIEPRSYAYPKPNGYHDVRISAYLCDPNEKNQGLKHMTQKYLGIKMITYAEMVREQKIKEAEASGDPKLIKAANKKSKVKDLGGFQFVHPSDAPPYACADADMTYRLFFLKEFRDARSATVRIDDRDVNQSGIYTIETRLIEVLRTQKKNRVLIDLPYIQTLERILQEKIVEAKKTVFKKAGKSEDELDIDSPKQLAKLLYKDLRLQYKDPYRKNLDGSPIYGIPKTEKGADSTDASILEWMAKESDPAYSIVKDILEYRGLYKALSTYILPLENGLNEFGEAKFNYNPYAAPTGRLAAGSAKISKDVRPGGYLNFNVHSVPKNYGKEIVYCAKTPNEDPGNIFHFKAYDGTTYCLGQEPKGIALAQAKYNKKQQPMEAIIPEFEFIISESRKLPEKCVTCRPSELKWGWFDISQNLNVRRAFKARPGFKLVAIDYSQIELRIAAALSKEPMWVNAFKNGEDVHEKTSLEMLGSKEKSMRVIAKACNFGLIYLGTAGTLAKQIKCSMDIARAHYEKWRSTVKHYCYWAQKQAEAGERDKVVATFFGRIRPIPKNWFEKELKGFGQRSSVNTVVQGTAADVLKFSLNKLDRLIENKNWQNDVKILLNVHDEIVFEVRENMVKSVVPDLVKTMECTIPKNDPDGVCLKAEAEVGENWGELVGFSEYFSGGTPEPSVTLQSSVTPVPQPQAVPFIGASVLDEKTELHILMQETPIPFPVPVVEVKIKRPRPKIRVKDMNEAKALLTYFTQDCPGNEDYEFDFCVKGKENEEVTVCVPNVNVDKITNDYYFQSFRCDHVGKVIETSCKYEKKSDVEK